MSTKQVISEEYLPKDTVTLKKVRLYVAEIDNKDRTVTAYMVQVTDQSDKVHTMALSRNQLIKLNQNINQLIIDTVDTSKPSE